MTYGLEVRCSIQLSYECLLNLERIAQPQYATKGVNAASLAGAVIMISQV
jgi:hypothetical protein